MATRGERLHGNELHPGVLIVLNLEQNQSWRKQAARFAPMMRPDDDAAARAAGAGYRGPVVRRVAVP